MQHGLNNLIIMNNREDKDWLEEEDNKEFQEYFAPPVVPLEGVLKEMRTMTRMVILLPMLSRTLLCTLPGMQ